MLYLIGLGLDKKDISLDALEAVKECEQVFLEHYTTTLPYDKIELEKVIKKKIMLIEREKVESEFLVKQGKKENVCLLVYGDPLMATTHISLLIDAKKAKVRTKVFHNASVFAAISDTGLQLYKFGKTTSIPRWQKNYKPTSFFETIIDNLRIGAHTLLLVDIGLSLEEALHELSEASNAQLREILICSKLGTANKIILYGKLEHFIRRMPRLQEPFCIIVPAKMHFSEEEYIKNFYSKD